MDKEEFRSAIIESLEEIEERYRMPYEGNPYERILCYEFYHQFRKRQDIKGCNLVFHGELEKHYRDIKKTPDFILHTPQTDEKNYAVVEFKSARSGLRWIKYDLKKLNEFMGPPSYIGLASWWCLERWKNSTV